MRRSRVAAAALLLLPVVLTAAPAYASQDTSQSLLVDKHAWSWRRAALPSGLPVDEPTQVPAGDLAVAFDGNPDPHPAKATYLHLDLDSLPASTTVEELTLTLPVDTAAQSIDSGGIRLVACRLLGEFPSGEGADPAAMPAEDCTSGIAGTYDAADASWSFAVGTFAQDWVASVNHGVVIRPALDYTAPTDAPFQLAFVGAAQVRAGLVATIPDAAPAPDPQPAPPPTVVGGGLTTVAAPPQLPSMAAAVAPVPRLAAAPQVAPAATTAQARLVSTVVLPPPRTSTGALFALAGLIGLLLVSVARAVGNTAPTLAYARAERRRLDRLRRPDLAALLTMALPRQEPQIRQGRRPMSSAASTVT